MKTLLMVIGLSAIPVYCQTDDPILTKFIAEKNSAQKEQLMNEIVSQPDVGPRLLLVAMRSNDIVTKWMSIRGIGYVKYRKAFAFLIESLNRQHPHVRANAARALGEIGANAASSNLIRLLSYENDGGVIEQTALALWMLGATEAVPMLKRVAPHPVAQTRCWVLHSIGILGTKTDIPFLAKYLYDPIVIVNRCAARAIEEITGEDFGLPRQSGLVSLDQGVEPARRWWEANKTPFRKLK